MGRKDKIRNRKRKILNIVTLLLSYLNYIKRQSNNKIYTKKYHYKENYRINSNLKE